MCATFDCVLCPANSTQMYLQFHLLVFWSGGPATCRYEFVSSTVKVSWRWRTRSLSALWLRCFVDVVTLLSSLFMLLRLLQTLCSSLLDMGKLSHLGGEPPVEMNPSSKFLVQDFTPLSESLLWDLLANYYKQAREAFLLYTHRCASAKCFYMEWQCIADFNCRCHWLPGLATTSQCSWRATRGLRSRTHQLCSRSWRTGTRWVC